MKNRLFTAAILEEQNKPFTIRKLEIPETLSCGQVLVRIKSSGICAAQLNEQSGVKGPDKYLPHCVGHEGGGTVRATGPGVRHVRIGDHVVVHWRKGAAGIEAEYPRYWCPELHCYVGGGANTTWQEFSVIAENRLTKISKDVPFDAAALLGCAVTTGLGVTANDLNIKAGQSIIVFGCGGVGLNVLQGAMLASAYPIIGVDITEEKLQQAIVFGATQGLNSRNNTPADLIKLLSAHTGGADYVVDTTGRPEIMELAWKVAGPSGKVCYVAQLRHDSTVPLQTLPMQQGRTLVGSDGGGTNPTVDIPRYLKLYKAGRLNLRGLISHVTTLGDINSTLDLIRAGKASRCIIDL